MEDLEISDRIEIVEKEDEDQEDLEEEEADNTEIWMIPKTINMKDQEPRQ